MKKLKYILLGLLPILLAVSIQFLVSLPVMAVSLLRALQNMAYDTSFEVFYNDLLRSWTGSGFTSVISLLYSICALIVFAIWYQSSFHALDVNRLPSHFNGKLLIGILCLMPGLQYLTTYLVQFVSVLRPQWLETYTKLLDTAGLNDITPALALYAVLFGPICEELIFRGVTMSYAKRALPFWAANLFQALMFGIYHMNMLQGVYAFFVGLFLGYICRKTGSIFPSMLLHIAFNSFGTFMGGLFMYRADQPFFFFLWLLVGIVLTFLGIRLVNSAAKALNPGNASKVLQDSSDM